MKIHLCVRRSGVLGCRNENFACETQTHTGLPGNTRTSEVHDCSQRSGSAHSRAHPVPYTLNLNRGPGICVPGPGTLEKNSSVFNHCGFVRIGNPKTCSARPTATPSCVPFPLPPNVRWWNVRLWAGDGPTFQRHVSVPAESSSLSDQVRFLSRGRSIMRLPPPPPPPPPPPR